MTKKKMIGTAAAILATSAVMAKVIKKRRSKKSGSTRTNPGASYSRSTGGSRRSRKARRATAR